MRIPPRLVALVTSLLLTSATGCVSFPANTSRVVRPAEQLPSGVARIANYVNYHPNNAGTGDYLATVELESQLAGLGGIPFNSFELNFYAPRIRPDGADPARAYQLQKGIHFYYYTDTLRPLMRALSSGQPMYVKWDLVRMVADISTDKTFAAPQPWPPLQIDCTPRP